MRHRAWAAVALVAAAALAAGGCGGDDDSGAAAPTTTEAASTAAPATTAAPETTPTAPAEPLKAGDAATGKQVFLAAPCANCHANAGTKAAVGPKLSGAGLTPAEIRSTIVNGNGIMPAGLVQGQDLNDVVAYVSSLQ